MYYKRFTLLYLSLALSSSPLLAAVEFAPVVSESERMSATVVNDYGINIQSGTPLLLTVPVSTELRSHTLDCESSDSQGNRSQAVLQKSGRTYTGVIYSESNIPAGAKRSYDLNCQAIFGVPPTTSLASSFSSLGLDSQTVQSLVSNLTLDMAWKELDVNVQYQASSTRDPIDNWIVTGYNGQRFHTQTVRPLAEALPPYGKGDSGFSTTTRWMSNDVLTVEYRGKLHPESSFLLRIFLTFVRGMRSVYFDIALLGHDDQTNALAYGLEDFRMGLDARQIKIYNDGFYGVNYGPTHRQIPQRALELVLLNGQNHMAEGQGLTWSGVVDMTSQGDPRFSQYTRGRLRAVPSLNYLTSLGQYLYLDHVPQVFRKTLDPAQQQADLDQFKNSQINFFEAQLTQRASSPFQLFRGIGHEGNKGQGGAQEDFGHISLKWLDAIATGSGRLLELYRLAMIQTEMAYPIHQHVNGNPYRAGQMANDAEFNGERFTIGRNGGYFTFHKPREASMSEANQRRGADAKHFTINNLLALAAGCGDDIVLYELLLEKIEMLKRGHIGMPPTNHYGNLDTAREASRNVLSAFGLDYLLNVPELRQMIHTKFAEYAQLIRPHWQMFGMVPNRPDNRLLPNHESIIFWMEAFGLPKFEIITRHYQSPLIRNYVKRLADSIGNYGFEVNRDQNLRITSANVYYALAWNTAANPDGAPLPAYLLADPEYAARLHGENGVTVWASGAAYTAARVSNDPLVRAKNSQLADYYAFLFATRELNSSNAYRPFPDYYKWFTVVNR